MEVTSANDLDKNNKKKKQKKGLVYTCGSQSSCISDMKIIVKLANLILKLKHHNSAPSDKFLHDNKVKPRTGSVNQLNIGQKTIAKAVKPMSLDYII